MPKYLKAEKSFLFDLHPRLHLRKSYATMWVQSDGRTPSWLQKVKQFGATGIRYNWNNNTFINQSELTNALFMYLSKACLLIGMLQVQTVTQTWAQTFPNGWLNLPQFSSVPL